MGIASQERDAKDQNRSNQWSHYRNEFQESAGSAQHQGVLRAGDPKKQAIRDPREGSEGDLSTNELCQHLIHIAEHALQKFALRLGVDERECDLAEHPSIFQKE